MDVGLGPDDFMLDGDPAPLPKKGAEPPAKFLLAHAYCGQTAGWIKMALRMEVGLAPYQVAFWCIQPFGHNRNGPKIGEGALPSSWGGATGSPSNTTKSTGLRPTSMPRAENWGLCPLLGEGNWFPI